MKELYLSENKLQTSDGMYIGGFLKENKHLEVLDLMTNQLQVSWAMHSKHQVLLGKSFNFVS
jgi:hypothetical protein